jgi:hypothetical protein
MDFVGVDYARKARMTNTILGVPFSYDLAAPRDEIKIHPDLFVKLMETCKTVDVYKHYNGTISAGGPSARTTE